MPEGPHSNALLSESKYLSHIPHTPHGKQYEKECINFLLQPKYLPMSCVHKMFNSDQLCKNKKHFPSNLKLFIHLDIFHMKIKDEYINSII